MEGGAVVVAEAAGEVGVIPEDLFPVAAYCLRLQAIRKIRLLGVRLRRRDPPLLTSCRRANLKVLAVGIERCGRGAYALRLHH